MGQEPYGQWNSWDGQDEDRARRRRMRGGYRDGGWDDEWLSAQGSRERAPDPSTDRGPREPYSGYTGYGGEYDQQRSFDGRSRYSGPARDYQNNASPSERSGPGRYNAERPQPRYGDGGQQGSYGSGYGGQASQRPGDEEWRHPSDYGSQGDHYERGFWGRGWREMFHGRDREEGEHRGRGPKNYRRSDDRIREDISDRLSDHPFLDASDIEVEVKDCEVTLSGLVASRDDKRRAEMLAERCSGVDHVQNNLRVRKDDARQGQPLGAAAHTTGAQGGTMTPDLGETGDTGRGRTRN